MSQIKVSITVPIFNAEKELPRCINSLIKQTLPDIEIILVDDGSTDSSGRICDEYALKDSRIRVLHKSNGGSGAARQLGLENSRGNYYTVCDADDWVEPNMYKELYNKAIKDDSDIVLSNHYINYPNGKQVESPTYKYIDQETYILDLMYHKTSVNTWNKLFKISTIRKYDINYEKGINLGEDVLFLYNLLLHPLKISTLNKPFYHYHRKINSNSYTNNITIKSFEQTKYVTLWKNKTFNSDKYKLVRIRNLVALGFIAIRTSDMNSSYFKTEVSPIISISDIIKNRFISLKSILVIFAIIFGYDFAKGVYNILYRYFYK